MLVVVQNEVEAKHSLISWSPFLLSHGSTSALWRKRSVLVPCPVIANSTCSYYLATSRELKRLDAVSRSPIFAWFSESLSGLSTIRAFGQQKVFIENNERRVDRNQICYLPRYVFAHYDLHAFSLFMTLRPASR